MANPLILDVLLQNNEISPKQVKRSLALYRKSRRPVGLILLEEGFVSEDTLNRYLAMEYDALMVFGEKAAK
ncbi:MAG TPA: hypothetical protein ENN21_02555 [Spirochaetes bacterium]|nr:hypothetical protein [Spirochaetota bacterium]